MAQVTPQIDITAQAEKRSILNLPNEILTQVAEYITKFPVDRLHRRQLRRFKPWYRCNRHRSSSLPRGRERGLQLLIPLSLTNRRFASITSPFFQKAACLEENSTLAIYFAAANGNEEFVRLLLAKAEGIRFRCGQGKQAITFHSPGIHDEVAIRYVMEQGPNFRQGHYSALEWAITRKNKVLLERVLERGADVYAQHDDGSGPRPVGECAFYESADLGDCASIGLLLKKGINVNVNNGTTALHLAVVGGHWDAINQLIKNGAYNNTKDKYGCKILVYPGYPHGTGRQSKNQGVSDLAWLFLEAIDDERPFSSVTPHEDLELIKSVLRTCANAHTHGSKEDHTPLQVVVSMADLDITSSLFLCRAGINPHDSSEWATLYLLTSFLRDSRGLKEEIGVILEYGLDADPRGTLILKVQKGSFYEAIQTLFSGPDIESSDSQRWPIGE